jgi:hypothetical protein
MFLGSVEPDGLRKIAEGSDPGVRAARVSFG